MKSILLPELYKKYNIANLDYGAKTDKLGDVYEDFICNIFNSLSDVESLLRVDSLERAIILKFFRKTSISFNEIISISASRDVPRRASGGLSKTDVIVYLNLVDDKTITVPISVKQTSASQVAFAEFDVNTICNEVKITDPRVKELMEKHQRDASAINFTEMEKQELTRRLQPFAEQLLRWTITMNPNKNPLGNEYPKWILKFNLTRETSQVIEWNLYNIEEYIDYIRLDRRGKVKKAGFGTGLSWTYATGSKGRKIQFKG